MTFRAYEVPEDVIPDIGTDARQIHAHAATATVRRICRLRRGWGIAIHLAGNGRDGCLGEWDNTTRVRKFHHWAIKGCKRLNAVIPGRCAASKPKSRDSRPAIAPLRFASRPGMTTESSGPPRNSLDKEVDDRLGGLFGFGAVHTPARKMPVDVHPRTAIDQRATGDLDLLQVQRAKLAERKRFRQRALGQFDQFGIVGRDPDRFVVIKKAAAGEDFETGRVPRRSAQVRQARAAKARQGIAGRRSGQRRLDLGAKAPQHPPEIAMVIGLWRRRHTMARFARRGSGDRRFGRGAHAPPGITALW